MSCFNIPHFIFLLLLLMLDSWFPVRYLTHLWERSNYFGFVLYLRNMRRRNPLRTPCVPVRWVETLLLNHGQFWEFPWKNLLGPTPSTLVPAPIKVGLQSICPVACQHANPHHTKTRGTFQQNDINKERYHYNDCVVLMTTKAKLD
jgi:hypothetical protein